jgi:hypothetical protein
VWVKGARHEPVLESSGRRLPSTTTRLADGTVEVRATSLLPENATVEVVVRRDAAADVLASFRTTAELTRPLPAGGDLARIDVEDGSNAGICASGAPRARLSFQPFAGPAPVGPVPVAVWSSSGAEPLVVDRPPDRIVYVVGEELVVQKPSICDDGEFWLPTGGAPAAVAAAFVSPNGTWQPPRTLGFRAPRTADEREQAIRRCKRDRDEIDRRLAATADHAASIHETASRRAAVFAATATVAALALVVVGVARKRRLLMIVGALVAGTAAFAAFRSTSEARLARAAEAEAAEAVKGRLEASRAPTCTE